MQKYHNTGANNGNNILLRRSRGTLAAPLIVEDGDRIGLIGGYGHDATGFVTSSYITFVVDGTPGTNDMPGKIVFNTTAVGASSGTERMSIDATGSLSINETTTAPAAVASQARIFAEDNGSGKTRIMAQFQTGSAVQIGIEV